MPIKDSIHKYEKHLSLLIIVSTIFLCYANTFNASWHFDDLDNILTNQALHISDLKPTTLINTFFANPIFPSQKIFHRPISNLTFALNWYLGGDSVWGYHFINISIHSIAAIFLFFSILQLYKTRCLATTDKLLARRTALFATLLWALNPIQTQAITYIVQRMASLAAMFYIIAIYYYLRARLTILSNRRLLYFICSLSCGLFAIGSKENAATIPFSLLLIEIIFFQRKKSLGNLQKLLVIFFVISIAIAACYYMLKINPLAFLNGYSGRSFTFIERLLTEPRIVITYLSQLFYPATFRLSLEHDIILSKSFLTPWTTSPALIFVFFLLSYATVFYKKHPLVSFSILFFFINHLIESTIIPLELVFEHRNYLPSMFLFVPIADFFIRKTSSYQETNPPLYRIMISFSMILLLTFGTGTYLRNMAWKSEETLWIDTIKKAPLSSRASFNLGKWYLKGGQYDKALQLFVRAEHLSDTAPTPHSSRIWALNGIGSVYLLTDRPEQAVTFYEKTLGVDPSYSVARYNLVLALFSLHKWKEAQAHLQLLLNTDQNNIDYLYMENLIRFNTNESVYIQSSNLKNALDYNPTNTNLLLLTAISYKNINQYEEALEFLQRYDKIIPGQLVVKMGIVEIQHIQNNFHDRDIILDEIITRFTGKEIKAALNNNRIMRMPIFSSEKMRALVDSFSTKKN